MERTLAAETVRKGGKKVRLCGWVSKRRDHGKIIFIDLRDRTGIVQVVCPSAGSRQSKSLRLEDVVEIEAEIQKRPKELINPELETGRFEARALKIKILARAKTPPFDIAGDGRDIEEKLRADYRYLDLRRPRMVKNLELRHKVTQHIRGFLDQKNFIEIETPILTKTTPEGARDFIVPSRLQPGKFYALPQSPQQYKQLLMVAGFEKYYQIARCFRDEDPRADRAYGEFTQLDLEMSFTTQDEILSLTEELMIQLTEEVAGKKVYQKPFPRFSHREALEKFGDDKFDLRDKRNSNVLAFAWVVDFPLFEKTETREIAPSHHPFTAPKEEDIPLLETDPMKVHSFQHDLVCNGHEVGGGSLRITDPQIQRKVFAILGHSTREIEKRFGHLLRAFEYGVPPHGGIALGLDRLLMLFAGEKTLREVIAFPMTASGQAAVMDAPSRVSASQLNEFKI